MGLRNIRVTYAAVITSLHCQTITTFAQRSFAVLTVERLCRYEPVHVRISILVNNCVCVLVTEVKFESVELEKVTHTIILYALMVIVALMSDWLSDSMQSVVIS